jgi:hypothetical protein
MQLVLLAIPRARTFLGDGVVDAGTHDGVQGISLVRSDRVVPRWSVRELCPRIWGTHNIRAETVANVLHA